MLKQQKDVLIWIKNVETVDEGVEAAEKCAENCMKYVETTKDVLKQQKNVLRILWLRYVF